MKKSIRLHSIQTLGTVDGPGIRTILFFQGCPYRCHYCHNPETWSFEGGETVSIPALLSMLENYRAYYGTNGGVTVSGGECLFQADFLIPFLKECRKNEINSAIDTCGMARHPDEIKKIDKVKKVIVFQETDLVILDVKFNSEVMYREYTKGTLDEVLETLSILQDIGKPVWIRQVIIEGVNDSLEEMNNLKNLIAPFSCIGKVELLPFRKLCIEKYQQLNIKFPFLNRAETSQEKIRMLQEYFDSLK